MKINDLSDKLKENLKEKIRKEDLSQEEIQKLIDSDDKLKSIDNPFQKRRYVSFKERNIVYKN